MKRLQRFRQHISSEWTKLQVRYLFPGKLPKLSDVLTIELTNRCSLACSCCPNGLDRKRCRPQATMTLADFTKLLDQIDVPYRKVFLHLHGEPFLNHDLPAIVELLGRCGVAEINIFSNAYRIDLPLLEDILRKKGEAELRLAFSAELYAREAYERLRCPGHFDVLWKSLDSVDAVMAKYDSCYSVNAIIDASFIDSLKDVVPTVFQRLTRLNDLHLTSAFPWPHLPETGDVAGHLMPRRPICNQTWEMPVILASGEVSMCNCDYTGECIVGSLWEHKFRELLNNAAARRFRRNLALRHPERNALCGDCLIDRHVSFSRVVRRRFVEKASAATLEKYFANYHKYFRL